jgi:hypothetical protein
MRSIARIGSGVALTALLAAGGLLADENPKPPAKKAAAVKPATTTTSLLGSLLGSRGPAKSQAQKDAEEKGSHKESGSIKVQSADGKLRMQTMAVDGEGRVLALVAPPRGFAAPTKGATGEVHVFAGDGSPVKHWKVNFHAHSINSGPDGSIYVAGDGRVAKFTRDGEPVKELELPFIADLLKDKEGMRKAAEEQQAQQKKTYAQIVEQYEKRIKDITDVPEEKRTKLQKSQLTQYESLVKTYKKMAMPSIDSLIQGTVGRVRIHNSIAVNEKDVFVVAGETKGYGYVVWRMDHEFKNPRQVLTGLRGCCGQMDVQCCGDDILVAENCNYQFALYDRDGKKKGGWGKSAANGNDLSGFGGCCNPMNVRATKSNEVYTAESEGLIKRFSDKGDFLGVVGYAPLTGGCKNVAVGVSPDGSRVYFADQPGSRVIVLTKKAAETKTEAQP